MIPTKPTITVTTNRSKAAIVAGLKQWFLHSALFMAERPGTHSDILLGVVDSTGRLFHGSLPETNLVMKNGAFLTAPEATTLTFICRKLVPLPNARVQLFDPLVFGFNDIAPVVPTIDLIEIDRLPGGPPPPPPCWGFVITVKKTITSYDLAKHQLARMTREYNAKHPSNL